MAATTDSPFKFPLLALWTKKEYLRYVPVFAQYTEQFQYCVIFG